MGRAPEPAAAEAPPPPATFRRLQPPGKPASATQLAEELEQQPAVGDAARRERPYVRLNMISTVDGRASLSGLTGPLSDRADRELFHALRAVADAVLVGAGTARAERYGRIIRDERVRAQRRERGLPEEPLALLVSERLALQADLPLLATPAARVVILTSSRASLPQAAAQVEYVRAESEGKLDLKSALAELRARFAVRSVLCEGGPRLNAHLLADGLVDELLLTLSPKLAGADPKGGEALRIVAGAELEAAVELELLAALESDSQLFLRYAVRA
jgi:riboflavin-specific deaminase-like protein